MMEFSTVENSGEFLSGDRRSIAHQLLSLSERAAESHTWGHVCLHVLFSDIPPLQHGLRLDSNWNG